MNELKALQYVGQRLRATKPVFLAIALVILLLIPQSSQGQFIPSPCCAVLASGLGSIASAITNVIGGALNAINRKRLTMHETNNFQLLIRAQMQAEREIILPVSFCFSSRRRGAALFCDARRAS